MQKQIIEFTTDKRFVRRRRALRTIEVMVELYCRGHDHAPRAPLCPDCSALFDYAARRLERCVFGDAKPTCTNCTVHCYSADMREKVRQIMKWSGPRMMWRHPVLAFFHILDGKRPAPMLPEKPSARATRPVPESETANR